MNNQQDMMSFTEADLAKFKSAYDTAVKNNQQEFLFENHEYVVDYAKYLIEYLTGEFEQ